MTIHLSFLIFCPRRVRILGAFGGRVGSVIALLGTIVALGYAVILLVDFDYAGGLQYVTDDEWIPELGIRYSLGVDGLNLWLVGLTALLFTASALWIVSGRRTARACSRCTSGSPRPPCSARSWRRTSRCSSCSST